MRTVGDAGPYGCLTEALFSRPFALKARGKGDHRRWWKGHLTSPVKAKERKNSHTLPALASPTPPSLSPREGSVRRWRPHCGPPGRLNPSVTCGTTFPCTGKASGHRALVRRSVLAVSYNISENEVIFDDEKQQNRGEAAAEPHSAGRDASRRQKPLWQALSKQGFPVRRV